LYLVPVLGATLYLLGRGWQLIAEPSARRAWRVFHGSNLYLALLLLAICLDTALRLP
jgi:heme O synthase-like polyprenyltransferase